MKEIQSRYTIQRTHIYPHFKMRWPSWNCKINSQYLAYLELLWIHSQKSLEFRQPRMGNILPKSFFMNVIHPIVDLLPKSKFEKSMDSQKELAALFAATIKKDFSLNMSIADPLRLIWQNGITNPSGRRIDSIEKLLTNTNITVNSAFVNKSISIHMGTAPSTINFLTHEADRFATAAFESLLTESTKPEFPRSIAWSLIGEYCCHSLQCMHC